MIIWRRRATLKRDEVEASLVLLKSEALLGLRSEESRLGENGEVPEVLLGRDDAGEKAVFRR